MLKADEILFKEKEREFRSTVPKGKIIGMRLDGKSFHTFTKQFDRPYDETFMGLMDETARVLAQEFVDGSFLAYVQSDEITIFFGDLDPSSKATLFSGGKVEKILSTAASTATAAFMRAMPATVKGLPVFDARLFLLDSRDEMVRYLHWRRLDARKNAITMAAGTLASHAELEGLSTQKRHTMIAADKTLATLPEGFFNGRMLFPTQVERESTFIHGQTQEQITRSTMKCEWVTAPASRELADSFRQ